MNFNTTGPANVATGWPSRDVSNLSPYRKLDSVLVDGERWYTIKCNNEVAEWVRHQSGQGRHWYEHIDQNWYVHKNKFDITEKIYIQICLRWG